MAARKPPTRRPHAKTSRAKRGGNARQHLPAAPVGALLGGALGYGIGFGSSSNPCPVNRRALSPSARARVGVLTRECYVADQTTVPSTPRISSEAFPSSSRIARKRT